MRFKKYLKETCTSTTVGQAYDFNPTDDIIKLPGIFSTSPINRMNYDMEKEVQGTKELKDYIKKYNKAKGNLLDLETRPVKWNYVDWKPLLKIALGKDPEDVEDDIHKERIKEK